MSEYIPTAEEVRQGFYIEKQPVGNFVYDYKRKITPEMVDRWLAEHDREVIREFINQQVEYVRNVMASEETE